MKYAAEGSYVDANGYYDTNEPNVDSSSLAGSMATRVHFSKADRAEGLVAERRNPQGLAA